MPYEMILLVLGVLLLLIGSAGKIKTQNFEVGISSGIARIVVALVGIVFLVLSFNQDTTKTLLSTPPEQTREDTQANHQELEKDTERAILAEEQRLKELKAARLIEDQNRKLEQARLAEEQRFKEAKETRLAEDQRRKSALMLLREEFRLKEAKKATLAEEQHLKEAKEARIAEERQRIEEQIRFGIEQKILIEQTRYAEKQHRLDEQARQAEEQDLIIPTSGGDRRVPIVVGTITFKGEPPPPKTFELEKFPNSEFCGQVDNDENGNRILKEVAVKDGKLQDVVVYIKGVTGGKPMNFKGTDVVADKCRFLVQNGPSTFVGVVVNKDKFRVLNNDADPDDPKAMDGVLHNPHGYEKIGKKSPTMFNLPLPTKGGTINKKVKLRSEKKGSVMFLECDQHNYMNAWFYPVKNPYYAIVGSTGTYSIDKVPPGKYTILAWHPKLGKLEKEILVGKTGKLVANFEFTSTEN